MGNESFNDWHVTPCNDLEPHTETDACACKPKVEVLAHGRVVTHNAYDGRE